MTISLLTRGFVGITRRIVQQVPLPPEEGQELLVKSLELPLPPSVTEAIGIHQSDVIIRTALVAAMADLRAHPELLDYVFASLPRDSMTMKAYGESEVSAAKEWFLKQEIGVYMTPNIDEGKTPCLTIKLQSSGEVENTLGDIHYLSTEENSGAWPALVQPFTPTKYSAATGIVTVSEDVLAALDITEGMFLIDAYGRSHEILETFSDGSFAIRQGTIADFRNAVIKGEPPSFVTRLESVSYRETYQIGVHVNGKPVYLTWLHSVIVFILLRYKQALLEARGLERTTFDSSDFERNEQFEGEFVFSRYISISGFVRHYWPKATDLKIASFKPAAIRVIDGKKVPSDTDPNDALWIGDEDVLSPKK